MTALLGCDFSSSPKTKKPIVMAWGSESRNVVRLERFQFINRLEDFSRALQTPGPWVGGFDLPFGLPRELIQSLGWPLKWIDCMAHYSQLTRQQIRDHFASFCDSRPVGQKFAHRQTDRPASSSPSMKWVNPPVAYMLHAGVPLMIEARLHFPGLHVGDKTRVALEAYPGMLARHFLSNQSYKSDDRKKQTQERLIARKNLIHGLESGIPHLNLRLKLSNAQRDTLVDDPKGDLLDAVLCMVQAAWADQRADQNYGMPSNIDSIEGWIVTAPQ